jgi:hypothetical protein
MKKGTFLTGILSVMMILALVLIGCPTGGDDGGGDGGDGGGGNANPLLGTWANDLNVANLTSALVFTDEGITGPGIAANTKLAYYAQNLAGNTDYTVVGSQYTLRVGANNYTADVSTLSSGTFSLADYITTGKVDFKRAKGTSGTDLAGIWVSDLPITNASFTIILIGGANRKKVWSATGNNVATPNYRITEDAGVTYVSWNGGVPSVYTISTIGGNKSLDIPPPIGGGNIALYPLYTTPTF